MSEKIRNNIEVDFLNKIYNYKGAVGVDDLFHMLKSNYGLKGDLFNKILGTVTQKEYCINEKIRKMESGKQGVEIKKRDMQNNQRKKKKNEQKKKKKKE